MRVYVRNMGGTPIILDLPTLTNGVISVDGIKFPDPQVPSADPNTLDDYEEGSWTPVLTFATPGDLNVVYSTQVGRYIKIGKFVQLVFAITTTTFTHTTAAGGLQITGVPFLSLNAPGVRARVGCLWQGVTKLNYTDMAATLAENSQIISIAASGSGQNAVALAVGDLPSGGNVRFDAALGYIADE
jgi:hypothetical protein